MNKILHLAWNTIKQNIFSSCVDPAYLSFCCSTNDSFFLFALPKQHSTNLLNQQRCLVSQRVDALGRWNKIIKIIRLTKNVAVTNGFFSSFFWEFTFQAGKNLKLDANETVRKDYRKAIKVTLKFVSTSAIFFLNVFPSKIFIQWNGQGLHRFKCILAKYTEITECIGKMRIIFFF